MGEEKETEFVRKSFLHFFGFHTMSCDHAVPPNYPSQVTNSLFICLILSSVFLFPSMLFQTVKFQLILCLSWTSQEALNIVTTKRRRNLSGLFKNAARSP